MEEWDITIRDINNLQYLDYDWDSYGSYPISIDAINRAVEVCDICKTYGWLPKYTTPTSDDSIILAVIHKENNKTILFEIDADISIGFSIRDKYNEIEFNDIYINNLSYFLTKRT